MFLMGLLCQSQENISIRLNLMNGLPVLNEQTLKILYLGLKHLEFTAASGSAGQLTSISGRDASIFWYPLLHVSIVVQIVGAVVLLTLLLSEALSCRLKTDTV